MLNNKPLLYIIGFILNIFQNARNPMDIGYMPNGPVKTTANDKLIIVVNHSL